MESDDVGTPTPWTTWRILREIIGILVVVGVVGGSILLSYQWLTNKPRAHRRRPEKRATLVEVREVRKQAFPVRVRALGTVTAARTVMLAARVGGEVTALSPEFVPGGRFEAGQKVISLDREDYELALAERRAELARREADLKQLDQQVAQRGADLIRAESALQLEKARQDVARQEVELMGETLSKEDKDLVLRKPQIASAEAGLSAARAAKKAAEASREGAESSKALAESAVKKAEIQLRRTEVKAPFNAVVTARSIDLGAQVSPGQGFATLVGTDEFWVELAVPMGELRWITIPKAAGEKGSTVTVFHEAAWGAEAFRKGHVLRLLPGLEPKGRMARLIVSIQDPLCMKPENRGKPAMILGAYVRAVMDGSELREVIPVPRLALRDGNRVWVMDKEDTLDIREVSIVWHGRDRVCVRSGLTDGERIVMSDLGSPVQGMALRIPGKEGGKPEQRRDRGDKGGWKGGRG
ncbi:MAG: efflux RND transporter periplasmic adaptor subunit [Planctomycetota bacterium]|jgi:RND family efflux transporter MFP subunit